MRNLLTFRDEQFGEIRTVEIDGEPWLVGKDVATALGYSNPRKALDDHVDAEDKRQGDGVTIRDSIGREQHPTIINESGLYSLVLSSKLPGAKQFRRWVTSEVLPSIRKHGAYMTPETLDRFISSPDFGIRLLTALKEEQEKRRQAEKTLAVKNEQILEMEPKVRYCDVVLNCKDLVAISVIAKDYGWSATRMNRYLHDKRVQYRQGRIWLPYQEYAERGFTSTKTISCPGAGGEMRATAHTYWTQAGRFFLYELLKADGVLPLIERAA